MNAKRKAKSKRWIVYCVIAVAIVFAAVFVLKRPVNASYDSVNAKTGDITTYYSFSGNIETKNRQNVMAEKIMQISEIKVKEGDAVNEGDVLIKTTAGDQIKSKINGEVVNLNVEENQQVMAGTDLMDVVDYNNLDINVKVDEYDISALEKGKEATVKIGAINKEFNGVISSMSKEGQIVNGVTFFTATVDLEKDESIKIGMSAEVKVISDMVKGVVTLPMSSIQFDDNNNPYVYKKDEKGTVVKAEITTGINDGTNVEIKSGVSDGETIYYPKPAASGVMGFRPGSSNQTGNSGGSNQTDNSGGNKND